MRHEFRCMLEERGRQAKCNDYIYNNKPALCSNMMYELFPELEGREEIFVILSDEPPKAHEQYYTVSHKRGFGHVYIHELDQRIIIFTEAYHTIRSIWNYEIPFYFWVEYEEELS